MDNLDWVKYLKDKKIIAIDPGKNGGIVVYSIDRDELVAVVRMPETPMDLLKFISKYQKNAVCYLEKVGGMPGQGGKSMFTFGQGVGHLEMALLACKVKTITVTPQEWQKKLQTGTKGKRSDREWKKHLKAIAQRIYPTVGDKFNLKTQEDWLRVSDALLISEYSRLIEKV